MRFIAMRRRIRRLGWEILPSSTRRSIKSAYIGLVGRIKQGSPRVERFRARLDADFRDRVLEQLEKIDVSVPTDLCRMMKRHGSDKSLGRHNYTTVYSKLFSGLRQKRINLFELGLGTNNPALVSSMGESGKPGASLRGWAEYFGSGNIFGADIDRDILFSEGRIRTFYCDQLDGSAITEMWGNSELPREFDIVIEDGLHTFEANVSFLENSLRKVRPGGFYLIEDVKADDLPLWRDALRTKYMADHSDFSFYLVAIPWRFNAFDNNLVLAHRDPA